MGGMVKVNTTNAKRYRQPEVETYDSATFTNQGPIVPTEEDFSRWAEFDVLMDKAVSLEHRMDRLSTLKVELEQSARLTTTIALESDMALESYDMTALFFGGESRQKKYELAMEAVNLGLAAIMLALAAAITAVIVAAIRMLRGEEAGTNGEVESLNPVAVAEVQKGVGQALVEYNQLTPDAKAECEDVLQQAKSGKVKRKKRAVKAAEEKTKPGIATERDQSEFPDYVGFVAPLSAFQMDHLSSGEYTQLIDQFLQTIDQSHPVGVLQDGNNAYRELVQASKNEQPVTDDHVSALKEHYIHLMANPRRLHAILMEQMKKLDNKQRMLDAGQVQFPESLDHALKTFAQAITSASVTAYARNRVEMAKELERMRVQAQAAQKIFTDEKANEKVGQKGVHSDVVAHGREVMKELHGLLAVMLKADLAFKKYWKSLDACARYLHWVVTTSRWNLSLSLHEQGQDRAAIASNGSIQRLDSVGKALESFRNKAR